MRFLRLALAGSAAALLVTGPAQGQAIVSATGGTINFGGPGFGTLTETFNQAGLSLGYTSGVTNFDAYLGLNPTHTTTFSGFEWFSNSGTTSASVTYDLGSTLLIDRFALWNEESSGIGSLDLYYSTDNITFFSLLSGLTPTDHGLVDYPADVFAFGPTAFRYLRLDMSDCPQPNVAGFDACAIGEVAFRLAGDTNVVPEPSTYLLVASGMATLALLRRRRRA